MYLAYSALLALALILGAPFWLVQMVRHGKYRAGLGERLGFVPRRLRGSSGPTIWIHAVSVGEVLAVSAVVNELRRELPYRIVVSTTTQTGQKLARERFGEASVFYFPLDFAACIRPYFDVLKPELVVLAETEFWPNFLRVAHSSGARVAVVNGRISDRSFPRYRRIRGLLAAVLSNVDAFLTQTEEDANRLVEIGAPSERVRVAGNLKFDVRPPASAEFIGDLRRALGPAGDAVVVAGSTVEGEESIVLEAFATVLERYPKALLVLAPRHRERFDEVAQTLAATGLRFWRRLQIDLATISLSGGVLVLDTIGELASIYEVAEIAFVGGSLVPRGGHNILEPAQHGAAILVGPHTENFRDIIALFQRADALQVVTRESLAQTLLQLIHDKGTRQSFGARARAVLESQVGATERTIAALRELLSSEGRR
ncbi:MAG TPA: 3-deoxy-D-manno-octulosonic acid transferase [Clostridia bacterium]|nr:3-deoxy-D-manno-octulosonic acid transferase [Clostridia bacterium]